jgi:hypothetical protein
MRRGGVTSSKSSSLPRCTPAPIPAYPTWKPGETSAKSSQTSSTWGMCASFTRARHCGAPAAQRVTKKWGQCRQLEWDTHPFKTLSVETFGCLSTPMARLLSDIGSLAVWCGHGLFGKEQFMSAVLQGMQRKPLQDQSSTLSTASAGFL